MYLHLGQNTVTPHRDILGIFDLDNTTASPKTRAFLEGVQAQGRLFSVGEELPKSFVLCHGAQGSRVYFSQLSSATLKGRAENNLFE